VQDCASDSHVMLPPAMGAVPIGVSSVPNSELTTESRSHSAEAL
jgi:hypothetical protein